MRKCKTMPYVMAVPKMFKDSNHLVLNFIAKVKVAARLCDFNTEGKDVDFTDIMDLVAKSSNMELQEDLLNKNDLMTMEAEKTVGPRRAPRSDD